MKIYWNQAYVKYLGECAHDFLDHVVSRFAQNYSYLSATEGSIRVARRAGR